MFIRYLSYTSIPEYAIVDTSKEHTALKNKCTKELIIMATQVSIYRSMYGYTVYIGQGTGEQYRGKMYTTDTKHQYETYIYTTGEYKYAGTMNKTQARKFFKNAVVINGVINNG